VSLTYPLFIMQSLPQSCWRGNFTPPMLVKRYPPWQRCDDLPATTPGPGSLRTHSQAPQWLWARAAGRLCFACARAAC
jgi:hypothetical protein